MPWYYYSGNISRPIPVKQGLSVSVKSHSRVEILEPNLREVQALIKKGVLRRTGRPAGVVRSVADEPIVKRSDIVAVTPKSALASRIAEKGVTSNKGQAPRKLKGRPEMTEGELSSSVDVQPKSVVVEPVESSVLDASGSDESLISDGSVEVLSNAEGSPDEDAGGKEDTPKKKKSRSKK